MNMQSNRHWPWLWLSQTHADASITTRHMMACHGVARVRRDKMLRAASKGLSDYVPIEDIKAGTVYPDLIKLRDISAVVRS